MKGIDNSVVNNSLEKEEICAVIKAEWNKGSNTRDDDHITVGFYMPRLMSDIPMGNTPWERVEPKSNTMIKNKNFPINFGSVEKCNYILAEPQRSSNTEQPALYPGESARVTFIDNDLKKPRYLNYLVDETKRSYDRIRFFVKDKAKNTSPDKEYEFYMDTKEGKVRIFTDTGRGEFLKYLIQIDTQNGNINIRDDEGRRVTIDSPTDTITIKNTVGHMKLSGGSFQGHFPDGCQINTPTLNVTGGVVVANAFATPSGPLQNLTIKDGPIE